MRVEQHAFALYLGQALKYLLHAWPSDKMSDDVEFGSDICPMTLRRTISRMGRTMSVTDRYFKVCLRGELL